MDIKVLMRQAQEVQKKMQKIQEELAEKEFEGSAGGDMVKLTINGAGTAIRIVIDPSLINKDEKEILEDLVIVAFNDAKKKSDDGSAESIRGATNGLPLPPGFKF
jgi:DNA-binding YbaB/EbfC family protein